MTELSEPGGGNGRMFNQLEIMVALAMAIFFLLAFGAHWYGAGIVLVFSLLFTHFWKLGYVNQWLASGFRVVRYYLRRARVSNKVEMGPLDLALGRDADSAQFVIRSLDQLGSLGIYSLTRFGKTRWLQVMLHQLVTRCTPAELQVAIVDPEQFDYRIWERIPHLMYPIARTGDQAVMLVNLVSDEMERRAKLFRAIPQHYMCNELDRYHYLIDHLGLNLPRLPRILFLIDEMDLFAKKGNELEQRLVHLAKRGQKKGVYLWAATQRPTSEIMNANIRAELTARLVGHMESVGDYYRVHGIERDVYQKMEGIKGRFMFYNEGEWRILQGAYLTEGKMEIAAARISAGLTPPTWASVEAEPARTKTPWRGSNDEKTALVLEWMAQFERKPTADEFMAEFDVKSANTANYWIDRLWHTQ